MKTEYKPYTPFDMTHFTLCEAAPDLLAAADWAVKLLIGDAVPAGCLEALKAAILKAKGDK